VSIGDWAIALRDVVRWAIHWRVGDLTLGYPVTNPSAFVLSCSVIVILSPYIFEFAIYMCYQSFDRGLYK
jgi:hypothetical protein